MNNNFKHCHDCVHYAIFSVVKLDLFIRALLLDCILALEKKLPVRLGYILLTVNIYIETPIVKNLQLIQDFFIIINELVTCGVPQVLTMHSAMFHVCIFVIYQY